MSDPFKRQEDQMKRLSHPKLDVFGSPVKFQGVRPCEEKPPRFSDKDCAQCPDKICEELPRKGPKQ